jgi:hypothetical protein
MRRAGSASGRADHQTTEGVAVSDKVKKKGRALSEERHAEIAARLGFAPEEFSSWENADGEYVRVKDGHALLLQDEGQVAWYGETAPNPTYPLVVPSVDLDEEADLEAVEAPSGPSPSDGAPVEPLRPDDPALAAGAARPQPVDAEEQHDALVEAKAAAAAEEKAVEAEADRKADEKKPPAKATGTRK